MKIRITKKHLNSKNIKKELTSEQIKNIKKGITLVISESGEYYE